MNIPGIQGIDFGFLYANGRRRSRYNGIRFHVRRKLPLNELPASVLLPEKINSVPCDVIEAAYEPHASAVEAIDPIQPGVSVGNVARQSTGSLGALVRDLSSGSLCVLSNWHVLCGSVQAISGEPISQPGPRHLGNRPPRVVARLLRWSDLSHGIDAAVGLVDPQIGFDLSP